MCYLLYCSGINVAYLKVFSYESLFALRKRLSLHMVSLAALHEKMGTCETALTFSVVSYKVYDVPDLNQCFRLGSD